MKRIRESAYRAFRIDAPLPPPGLRRLLVIAWLVLGALVALFVPLVLAALIWGVVTGQDRPASAPAGPSQSRTVNDGARGTP